MTQMRAIIGPSFFGYLEDIAARFTARGVPTRFYDERPSNTVSQKLFVRLAPAAVRERALAAHLERLIEQVISDGVREVLLVSSEVVTPAAVQRWQAAGLRVSLYLWDSLRNKPNCQALVPLMDAVGSFDPDDCERLGFEAIPLYSAIPASTAEQQKEHDFFFCTTLHSNRPRLVSQIQATADRRGWTTKFFLFYHSRVLWALRYAAQPNVWALLKQLHTRPFSWDQISNATRAARAVIDLHHGAQSGLTMRSFEVLAAGTVLVTTNPNVTSQLPETLHDRVVPLALDDIEASLAEALTREPKPLPHHMHYALGVERFLDQIAALLSNEPVPGAFDDAPSRDSLHIS